MFITIASQKGGTGKTTTAVTVAHALAMYGWQVLLVDLDPQGHCAISLAMDPAPGAFDVVVLDTPAAGLFQEAAIKLADRLIVPFRCETLGLDGVNATWALAYKLHASDAPLLLPVAFDKRLGEHTYNLNAIRTEYMHQVRKPIPARVAVAEAHACGQTIWEYRGAGIDDVRAGYRPLVDTIIEEKGTSRD